jgi:transposase
MEKVSNSVVLEAVVLQVAEVAELERMLRKGTHPVRMLKRASVLLGLHEGLKPQEAALQAGVSLATVYNIIARYKASSQLNDALQEKPRSGQPTKFSKAIQSQLPALACSEAPEGHSKWSLRMLADKLVELQIVASVSHQAVGEQLKKMSLSPG